MTKGKSITVKGRLRIADWTKDAYVGAASRTASIQFKATGAKSYATVKTVKTDKAGWINTKVTAKKSGSWRAVYSGSSIAASAISVGDAVKVRS